MEAEQLVTASRPSSSSVLEGLSFSGQPFEPGVSSTYCPACNKHGMSFSPLPDFIRQNAEQHQFTYFGRGEMTALQTYLCPACGASDRERLYALWLDQEIGSGRIARGARLIHFAPEHTLSRKLRASGHFDYRTADAMMTEVDHVVDLMSLPFPDGAFDLFICSHVLEHVEDDRRAVAELFRVLASTGRGILMVPITVGLEKTLEDPSITSEADRWRHFGQNDHVRLYAHDDYVAMIAATGFLLDQLGVERFGRETFRSLGLKDTSVLYVVTKP